MAEEKPAGGNKTVLFIVLGIFIGISAGLGGALVFMLKGNAAPQSVQAEATVDEEPTKEKPAAVGATPYFHKFMPPFVINLSTSKKPRFLQVEVQVMTRSENAVEDIVTYEPLLKNHLVTLFSKQNIDEMNSAEGKEKLRAEATDLVKQYMLENTGKDTIEEVLFTGFVTQ